MCRTHLVNKDSRHPPVSLSFRLLFRVRDLFPFSNPILMVMAELGITIPPGQSAPFATITPTDHRAWIIISTALGLSMSLLFVVIRVYIRSATKHGFGKDDYALAAATVSYCVFKVARRSQDR